MSIKSAGLLAILLTMVPGNFGRQTSDEFPWTYDSDPEATRTDKRSDLRAAIAGKLDPNFWPARGRRNDDFDPEDASNPFKKKYRDLDNVSGATGTRGRKTDDEESGVFWAGRGRNVDRQRSPENDPEETFWANRGRSLDGDGEEDFVDDNYFYDENQISKNREKDSKTGGNPEDEEIDTRWRRHRLFVEEPGWVWLARREARPAFDVSFAGGAKPFLPEDKGKLDLFWVARGKKHKKQKRETGRFKPDPCWSFHPKRNSKNVMRELSQLNHNRFWPARGKRPALDLVAKHLAGTDRGSFWPARGKRPETVPTDVSFVWPTTRGRRSEKSAQEKRDPKVLKTL